MERAVFLDRDGTVSEEAGYINHMDRFRMFPWSAGAIRRLNDRGIRTVIVTNQSGIARGLFPEELVTRVHDRLRSELAREGAHVDGIYYCPHHPHAAVERYRLACDCRKPAPGMLLQAAREWGVDLGASYIVGDRYVDVEMAHRAGARGVLVMTGYGRGEYEYFRAEWPRPPDFVAEDLAGAVEWILGRI